jgi:signal transduction histidine kinase
VAAVPSRLIAIALACSLALGAAGWAWKTARFGLSSTTTSSRLEAEVRRQFGVQARQAESFARRAAGDAAIIAAIGTSDRTPELFARLTALAPAAAHAPVSATIYTPAGPAGAYRILAWSDGPADDLTQTPDRLTGPAALFVAPGTGGLSLVFVQPIVSAGHRLGIVAAETVLSPRVLVGSTAPDFVMQTSYGPVHVQQHFAGATEGTALPSRFLIGTDGGQPLIDVTYSTDDLAARRAIWTRRIVGLAALPLIVFLLLSTGPVLGRRSQVRDVGSWVQWSLVAAAIVLVAAAALVGLARLVGVSPIWPRIASALAALAVVSLFPVSAWWRRWRRHVPERAPIRFLLEQLGAGVLLAAAVGLIILLLNQRITPTSLEKWEFPLLPIDLPALLDLGSLLVAQIAAFWAAGATVAVIAARWKLSWRHEIGWAAAALWIAPSVAVFAVPALAPAGSRTPAIAAVSLIALFGLFALAIRRAYRHTTQAMRLMMLFAALLLPVVGAYPLASASANRGIRALIEREYAPATAAAQQPAYLLAVRVRAEQDVDRITNLLDLVASGPSGAAIQSQPAFLVWNQTTLSRERVTSQIELYGPNRALVSRFALNVPEFRSGYETAAPKWTGTGCHWEAFTEVAPLGAEERSMLRSERGICDAAGNFAGAIVIHIVPDYRALPFVSTANPYYEVLGGPETRPAGSRIAGLQVVVSGWSLAPIFASGRVAWPISDQIYARLYRSRAPFWTTVSIDDQRYEVYFLSDRAKFYALGYPPPTLFQHLSRLSEVAVVIAALFILMLIGAAIYAPFARRRVAPLRVLFHEIRTSFYRKLFLFFVLAAVAPVLLFATAFGTYMSGKFQDDVEGEAANVVGVARRVFEELAAVEQRPTQASAPNYGADDDVMVWIRQVIGQDVNLYRGPDLVATSQRDLFDSGLLPARTPAAVYRAIALSRLPVAVAADRIGTFEYLVAAAPVSARGRDVGSRTTDVHVLSVPLASRQREIDRQIDELNRGVLVGAVVVVIFAAALGASVAGRVSDPVARLTRATRLVAAGRLDVRLVADTADELGRLVEDFNSMTETLMSQRAELARTNQLKAWAEMARQVAHEIKNPLTPIQLAAEHLQRVHEDRQRPLGPVFDQCLTTILRQVKLLRQIASEFSSFAGQLKPRLAPVSLGELVTSVVDPYRLGLAQRVQIDVEVPDSLPPVHIDRTLIARALTNLVENAVQAMPAGGQLTVTAADRGDTVEVTIGDTGVGMDAEAVRRAFEPYFSTKTAGSGLGLANAKRNIELCGGTIAIDSVVNAGTRVMVTLPAAPRSAAVAALPPPSR